MSSIKAKCVSIYHKIEDGLAMFSLFFLGLIPVMDVVARTFYHTTFPNSNEYTQNLVVIVAFIAAVITSRGKEHLSLSLPLNIKEPYKSWIHTAAWTLAGFITTLFFWGAFSFVLNIFDPSMKVGIIPIRWVGMIMVIGYGIIALRYVTTVSEKRWPRIITLIGLLVGTFFSMDSIYKVMTALFDKAPGFIESLVNTSQSGLVAIALPLIILLLISLFFGAPIYVILGGIAYLLFARQGESLEVITNEAYVMLTSHSIAAIPLFTVAGFILSESKAGERLVNLFRKFFGWIPGGLAIMSIMVCTFFTTFTGASGVTILALGGLLSYVLINGKYEKKFSTGILTASGSIGLLFPPSLPIILYGVIAGVSIKELFAGGILPGIVMVLCMVIYSIIYATKKKTEREPFHIKEALKAMWQAKWEILLPVIIVAAYFGGIATIVECAAIAVIYALVAEVLFNRDLKLKDLKGVFLKGVPIIGGVLIILSLAKGLSYYIVDAEVPMKLTAWVQANIHSKYIFLLLVNVVLLLTGCLMDIFSAIMVVVPLIIPVAASFGIHPVHLGIIFLANMELGYLTPPVGLNLYLASYRFKEPMSRICRDVIPFLIIQIIAVLLITYIPFLSTALIKFVQ